MFNDFIREQFKGHKNLKILFRNENQTVWDQFLEKIEDAHFYYFSQELNYQKLYQVELGYEDQDLSFVIFYDNKVVSVFGLSVLKKKYLFSWLSWKTSFISDISKTMSFRFRAVN